MQLGGVEALFRQSRALMLLLPTAAPSPPVVLGSTLVAELTLP